MFCMVEHCVLLFYQNTMFYDTAQEDAMTVSKMDIETPVQSPDDLLYIDEVAEILRKTPAALRGMMHTGNAPISAKIGKRRVFRRRDVTEWIDAQFDKASA